MNFSEMCKRYPWCVAYADNYEAGVTPEALTRHKTYEAAQAEFEKRLRKKRRDNYSGSLTRVGTFERVLPLGECRW